MFTDNLNHEIGRDEANGEIVQYLTLKKKGFSVVRTMAEVLNLEDAFKNFYGTAKNAFIVEREDVIKFFLGNNATVTLPDPVADTATHLLLILASHTENDKGFEVGSPTIIVAGVKFAGEAQTQTGDDTFLFRTTFGADTDKPATQWEKQYTVSVLPDDNKEYEEQILFGLK